jgi:hypothetical protein
MSKEFVPYEEALALKELGFDNVPCLAIYYNVTDTDDIDYDAERHFTYSHYETQYYANKGYKDAVLAPLYQQAFRWIMQFPQIKKWRCNVALYPDGTYSIKDGKEAIHEFLSGEECLRKLIEIVKETKYE